MVRAHYSGSAELEVKELLLASLNVGEKSHTCPNIRVVKSGFGIKSLKFNSGARRWRDRRSC